MSMLADDAGSSDCLTKEELIQRRLGSVKALFSTYKVESSHVLLIFLLAILSPHYKPHVRIS